MRFSAVISTAAAFCILYTLYALVHDDAAHTVAQQVAIMQYSYYDHIIVRYDAMLGSHNGGKATIVTIDKMPNNSYVLANLWFNGGNVEIANPIFDQVESIDELPLVYSISIASTITARIRFTIDAQGDITYVELLRIDAPLFVAT